jgi:hypothetical protein
MERFNLKQKCREYIKKYEIYRFNCYRDNYDNLSFREKKKLARYWLKKYPEQAHFSFEPVEFWLKEYVKVPARILEIGGWRGDLAMKVLSSSNSIELWHNYDLLENNNSQRCSDCRYQLIPLDDYLWNKSLNYEYNTLIATHMIEHIKWNELLELINWIPETITTVLFEAPIPFTGENISWKGDHSSHVLEKGWEAIINEMNIRGFRFDYNSRDTYVFNK